MQPGFLSRNHITPVCMRNKEQRDCDGKEGLIPLFTSMLKGEIHTQKLEVSFNSFRSSVHAFKEPGEHVKMQIPRPPVQKVSFKTSRRWPRNLQ